MKNEDMIQAAINLLGKSANIPTTSQGIASSLIEIYKGIKEGIEQIESMESLITFKSRVTAVENPAYSSSGTRLNLARVKLAATSAKYAEQNLWVDFANPRFNELIAEAQDALAFGEDVIIYKKQVSVDGSTRSFFEGAKLPPSAVGASHKADDAHQERSAQPAAARTRTKAAAKAESEPEESVTPARTVHSEEPVSKETQEVRDRIKRLPEDIRHEVIRLAKADGLGTARNPVEINKIIDRLEQDAREGEGEDEGGDEVFYYE